MSRPHYQRFTRAFELRGLRVIEGSAFMPQLYVGTPTHNLRLLGHMATEYAELIALVNKANTAQKAAFVEADLTLDTIATATGAQNTTAVLHGVEARKFVGQMAIQYNRMVTPTWLSSTRLSSRRVTPVVTWCSSTDRLHKNTRGRVDHPSLLRVILWTLNPGVWSCLVSLSLLSSST